MIRLSAWLLSFLLLILPLAGPPLHGAAGRILLILDDMGHPIGAERLAACQALPPEVAFSIIPGTPLAAQLADRCTRLGRDYLAHLPWEPLNPHLPAERLLLPVKAGPDQMEALVSRARRELPDMVAANNHQGSRASLDRRFLETFARTWQPLGLPFIDSRTIAGSRVPDVLGAAGILVHVNRIFLDHVDSDEAIAAELKTLESLARREGTVIAIAHPRPRTLRLLARWLDGLPPDLALAPARLVLSAPRPGDWLAQRAQEATAPQTTTGWPTAAFPAAMED